MIRRSRWTGTRGLVCLLLLSCHVSDSHASTAGLICGRNDDYLGQSLPRSYFETHADVDSRDATSAPDQETPLLRVRHRGMRTLLSDATHYSEHQVPQRSAVRRVEGGGAYELENVCIHARFKGGVTLHGVEDISGDGDGLPLCNEAGCFTFPVTYTNDKLPHGKRGHSGWIEDATAVIMPLTAGNPWHFLHHVIPLSHVGDCRNH
ncbi:unnamed protein product [Closterium sp. NIES-53]